MTGNNSVVWLFALTCVCITILYANAAECPKHEEMNNCGSLCEPSCENKTPDCGFGPGVPPSCSLGPMRKCRCKVGHFRKANGKCVKKC